MAKETIKRSTHCYGDVDCTIEQDPKHGEVYRPIKEMKLTPKTTYGKKK